MTKPPLPHLVCVGVLVCVTVLFCYHSTRLASPPFEDAAMLLRYSEHIAAGHGIVWNPGGPPVDGATDFLPMLWVAALVRVGIPSTVAMQALGLIAHLATVILIYAAVRGIQRGRASVACFTALYFALGPGVHYIDAGLATPIFATVAAAAWFLALRIMGAGGAPRARDEWGFILLSILLGLVRPEGVFLALFLLLTIGIGAGFRDTRRLMRNYIMCYAVVGGLFLLWRWHYFGHMLPNPFYRKGGGQLYWRSLRGSVETVFCMGAPFFLPPAAGLLRQRRRRAALAALFPILAFTAIWVLLSDEMNFGGRFQYACLPLLLMSWYPFMRGRLAARAARGAPSSAIGAVAGVACTVLACGVLWAQANRYSSFVMHDDGRYDVARRLGRYADRGYVIATTEAGLLPLFSGWRAVDAWGLNDTWIARHGIVTPEYLDRYRPAVIMWHATGAAPGTPPPDDTPWNRMVRVLLRYVRDRGYIPAAAYGEKINDNHVYWVDPKCPEAEAIRRAMRIPRYVWYASGHECADLLSFVPGSDE